MCALCGCGVRSAQKGEPNDSGQPSAMSGTNSAVLRILHVSDTHCALDKVAAIARIAAQGQHDCVVLTGDLALYDHVTGNVSVIEAEADAHSVLQSLEAGHELPVYFLPGNRTCVRVCARVFLCKYVFVCVSREKRSKRRCR